MSNLVTFLKIVEKQERNIMFTNYFSILTMQLGFWQFDWRFVCVMLIADNVSLSHKPIWGVGYGGLVSLLLSKSTSPDLRYFQTCWLQAQPTLSQVTHFEQFFRFHAAPFGATKGFSQYNCLYCIFNTPQDL